MTDNTACLYIDKTGIVCGLPGFSQSAEHENFWFCAQHYFNWLKSLKKDEGFAKSTMQQAVPQ